MKNDSLRLADYIDHMLQAIQRISRYTGYLTEETFLENEQVQDAVLRNIEIIGEAARNIVRSYPEFIVQHSTIPWEDVYLMRNRICHGYFSVDLEIVWKTVQRDLPKLERQIRRIPSL